MKQKNEGKFLDHDTIEKLTSEQLRNLPIGKKIGGSRKSETVVSTETFCFTSEYYPGKVKEWLIYFYQKDTGYFI